MKLSNLAKRVFVAFTAVVAAVGISSAAIAGFGPDRPTKAWNPNVNGFDSVVFNSFTGVGNGIGDERDFLRGSIVGTQNQWSDPVNNVPDGAEVEVKLYIHNGADKSLNDIAGNPGIAKNVLVKVALPTTSAQAQDISGSITADNATPKVITDTLSLTGLNGGFFEVTPVAGSARIVDINGASSPVSDTLFTSGVNIGDMKGCFEFRKEVIFRVKIKMPNYSIAKESQIVGSNTWAENTTGTATDTFGWRITFNNIGNTQLTNVKIVDNVPASMTVVPGSVRLWNGNYPNGYTYDASAIQANGRQINVDIGNYNPGPSGVAYVTFRTTINAGLLACGANSIVNEAFATPTGYGAIRDTASVSISRTCVVPETPVYRCDDVKIEKLGGRKVKVSVATTGTPANRVSIKSYEYNYGDGKTPLVTDKNVTEYTYDKDGTYKVAVKVNFTVDGANQTVSGEQCAEVVTFTSTTPPTTLPNTGAGSMIGIFLASAIAGLGLHRLYALRRS